MGALPMLGNPAWAPMRAIENVEVLDRFNGVPTLGLFSAEGERALFWRALGATCRPPSRSGSMSLSTRLLNGDWQAVSWVTCWRV